MLEKKTQTVKFYQLDAGLEKATPAKRHRETVSQQKKTEKFWNILGL
jgi:hypothetical protein